MFSIIVLLINFSLTNASVLGFFKESFCLDEISSNILPLTCPTNHLIKLARIVYGYSWSNDCSYIDKDCTMNVPPEDILCSTTNQCTVKVVQDPLILQDCWNLPATYIQAEYECIQNYSLQNLCQSQETNLSEGFLSTPNYPKGFSSNFNCPCVLIAPPAHSIVFELIDIQLPNCSDAGLLLWIGDQFQSKCQRQNPMTVIGNPQQNITLRFYSLTNVSHGGVLMKYSILPSTDNATIRMQCYSSRYANHHSTMTMVNENRLSFVSSKDLGRKFSSFSTKTTITTIEPINSRSPNVKKLSSTSNSTSMTTIEMLYPISIITGGVVFCLISVNVILCCLFLTRSKRSKTKVSEEPIPIEVNQNVPVERTPRLRTLHSLLYPEHQPAHIPSGTLSSDADLDSHLSEYHRVIFPTIGSTSTNITRAFSNKTKINPIHDETHQINTWDDI